MRSTLERPPATTESLHAGTTCSSEATSTPQRSGSCSPVLLSAASSSRTGGFVSSPHSSRSLCTSMLSRCHAPNQSMPTTTVTASVAENPRKKSRRRRSVTCRSTMVPSVLLKPSNVKTISVTTKTSVTRRCDIAARMDQAGRWSDATHTAAGRP